MRVNQFSYEIPTGKVSGAFNIYQANSGIIYMMMGKSFTKLEYHQINDLCIDVYSLKDFDHDLFMEAYGSSVKFCDIEAPTPSQDYTFETGV